MNSESTVPSSNEVANQKKIDRINGDYLVRCYVEKYEELFLEKRKKLSELLSWPVGSIEAFESPKTSFRMRTNFQMWHDDPKNRTPEGFYYAMYDEKDPGKPREVTNFPRGTPRINHLMQELSIAFMEMPVIYQALFEVRFVTTKLDEESIIVLCYKRPLAENWLENAEKLAAKIGKVKIIGRARKMFQMTKENNITGDEYIKETLSFHCHSFDYYQTEGAFSQPNAAVCEKMVEWSLSMTKDSKDHDLLELYCGGGTFTAPFSINFRKVLATEISKASVDLARKCFKMNDIGNIKVIRMSSEEFTDFYLGKREFGRVKEENVRIEDYDIKTVFVDPPRAGLDPGTTELIARFDKIVYVSCNPHTLARDVKALSATHEMVKVAAFDQFPYTDHLESGVVLVRKATETEAKEEEAGSNEPATKKMKLENEGN
jgi:tRNA (uracil-5-)-methyltransferase